MNTTLSDSTFRAAPVDPHPAQLGECSWGKPLMFAGNSKLLERKSVGIVGARDITSWWMGYVEGCGQYYAKSGYVVVTGGARGTDEVAYENALFAGGSVIIVAPCGMNEFSYQKIKRIMPRLREMTIQRRKEMDESLDKAEVNRDIWSRILIVSPFPNDKQWTPRGAMMRNEIIVRLSTAGIIICRAVVGSGTAHCGLTALRLRQHVFVPQFEGGNVPLEDLVGRGGVYLNGALGQKPRDEHNGKLVFDDGTGGHVSTFPPQPFLYGKKNKKPLV